MRARPVRASALLGARKYPHTRRHNNPAFLSDMCVRTHKSMVHLYCAASARVYYYLLQQHTPENQHTQRIITTNACCCWLWAVHVVASSLGPRDPHQSRSEQIHTDRNGPTKKKSANITANTQTRRDHRRWPPCESNPSESISSTRKISHPPTTPPPSNSVTRVLYALLRWCAYDVGACGERVAVRFARNLGWGKCMELWVIGLPTHDR